MRNLLDVTLVPWWVLVSFGIILVPTILRSKSDRTVTDRSAEDQAELDAYLRASLSNVGIGTRYERYIGYLYEKKGCAVRYNGIKDGYEDLGRDLIVRADQKTLIVQTKCWAKQKQIRENHVYQLYGSLEHYKRQKRLTDVEGVFFTTATYSKAAIDAGRALGIELRIEKLDRGYPMIKCSVSGANGDRTFYLPSDETYDDIEIHAREGDGFARTVDEAVARGFHRVRSFRRVG